MLKQIFAFCTLILFSYYTNADNKGLNAFYYSSVFHSHEHGSYLETYIAVVGSSVNFVSVKEGFQARVEVTMLFKQDNKIVNFRKYFVNSPLVSDTASVFPNFIDLRRIPLDTGVYNFELIIKDVNKPKQKEFSFNDIVTIKFSPDEIMYSGIELVESYTETEKENILSKNNYDLVPYVSEFFPKTIEILRFYAEIYNVDKSVGLDNGYLFKYYIEAFHTNKSLSKFNYFERQLASPTTVVFKGINISELPSGNYNLVLELRDNTNKMLKQTKLFFQRSNPGINLNLGDIATIDISKSFVKKIENIDTLKEYVKCLRPISDQLEIVYAENQLKSDNIKLMQQFFLNFWRKRNEQNAELEWYNYLKQVEYVNKAFSTQIMKGYETERGRVYLQYGTPNTITDKPYERGYFPYQIWHYYHTQGQSNRKFVFYKPGLAVNDYELIHSNAKGEISNKNWAKLLVKNMSNSNNNRKKTGGVYDDYNFIR